MKLPIHVQVTWLDAHIDTGASGAPFEQQISDFSEDQIVVSHGILVQVGKVNLILAMDSDKAQKEFRGLQRIPRVLVHGVKAFQPTKNVSPAQLDSLTPTAGSVGASRAKRSA